MLQHQFKEEVYMVVAVTSVISWGAERRTVQRKAWKRTQRLLAEAVPGASALLYYMFGIELTPNGQLAAAEEEAAEHNDVVFLPCPDEDPEGDVYRNFYPAPSATTSKVLLSLRWAEARFRFKWFVRLGDDAYFRADKFASLEQAGAYPLRRAVIGRMGFNPFNKLGVFTDHLSNTTVDLHYPLGMGYVLPADVAMYFAGAAPYLINSWPEDGCVGAWVFGTNIKLFNDLERFHGSPYEAPCTSESVLIHKPPDESWGTIDEHGVMQC